LKEESGLRFFEDRVLMRKCGFEREEVTRGLRVADEEMWF
jgi:hypothetical protein